MPRKRYYSDDDMEIGVTPSQLKRMGKSKQLGYLLWWFGQMFEDPANETPYNSQEGGYLYIWGGPYDAKDELYSEFGHVVSEEIIDRVVDQVESEGLSDWAPGPKHPARDQAVAEYDSTSQETEVLEGNLEDIVRRLDDGITPAYGSEWESSQRRQILSDLDKLLFELPTPRSVGSSIGHNNPPQEHQFSEEDIPLVRETAIALRAALVNDAPDARQVVKSVGRLRTLWEGAKKYAAMSAEEFSKSFGKAAGILVAPAAVGGIVLGTSHGLHLLGLIVQSAIEWLDYVTLPY